MSFMSDSLLENYFILTQWHYIDIQNKWQNHYELVCCDQHKTFCRITTLIITLHYLLH